MLRLLSRVNHVLDIDLRAPLGRRAQMVLLLVAVLVVGQAAIFAQSSQTDCVGDYEKAVNTYYNDMMVQVNAAYETYGWYNPMRTVITNEAGVEYYAKCESAWFQMIACTTVAKIT